MAIDTSQRIKNLENEIRALKATYSVYGGAMKLYLSTSPVYQAGGMFFNGKVKFTPSFPTSGNIFVASVRYDISGDSFFSHYAITNIQDGSGSVVIEVPVVGGTFSVSLVATTPGTFTRLQ